MLLARPPTSFSPSIISIPHFWLGNMRYNFIMTFKPASVSHHKNRNSVRSVHWDSNPCKTLHIKYLVSISHPSSTTKMLAVNNLNHSHQQILWCSLPLPWTIFSLYLLTLGSSLSCFNKKSVSFLFSPYFLTYWNLRWASFLPCTSVQALFYCSFSFHHKKVIQMWNQTLQPHPNHLLALYSFSLMIWRLQLLPYWNSPTQLLLQTLVTSMPTQINLSFQWLLISLTYLF